MVYENGSQKYLLTEEGYVTLADSKYHYYLKDHQGNNRVVISSTGTVEETNHYYPFGGVFAATNNIQPYKYNGKELDTKNGLNWYDYGARHYDAALGRFVSVDRFAEKYPLLSPYQYAANNPVVNVDVNGDSIVIAPNPKGLIDNVKMLFGYDTQYQEAVKTDLNQLKLDDDVVANMITELEESSYIHEITLPKTDQWNRSISDKEKSLKGIPHGTVVWYDPNKESDRNGNIRTPRVSLAHELRHSLDIDRGTYVNRAINGIPYGEIPAINIENRIRKVTNDEKRIKYGKIFIPKGLLE